MGPVLRGTRHNSLDRMLVWVATHLVTYGEEFDEKEMKEETQKKVYQQRYGLFTDFGVARQSRIYGFAPSWFQIRSTS